jgi:hypothetical protein
MKAITIEQTNVQRGANDFARTFSLVCRECPIGSTCATGLQDSYGTTRLSACEYLHGGTVKVASGGVFIGQCNHAESSTDAPSEPLLKK